VQKLSDLSPQEQRAMLGGYDPDLQSLMHGTEYTDAAKRQDAIAKEIDRVRKLRINDPEFKQRLTNSLTEASRSGEVKSRSLKLILSITSARGRAEGLCALQRQLAARPRRRARRRAQPVGAGAPAQDVRAPGRMMRTMPKPPSATIRCRRRSVRSRWSAARILRPSRSGACRWCRRPISKFAGALGDQTATIEDKQAAAREFATKMEMEQARIGVPAEERTLAAEGIRRPAQRQAVEARGRRRHLNVAGMIENEAKIWGDAWPQVYKQLSKGAAPVVMVIGSGVKPAAAQILAEFANTKLGDIANDQSEEKLSTIRKDVRDAFRPLLSSMSGNEGTPAAIDAFQAAGEKLAAYYVRQGKTSTDAAKQAFDDLLGTSTISAPAPIGCRSRSRSRRRRSRRGVTRQR
jgi:hypothetical protein